MSDFNTDEAALKDAVELEAKRRGLTVEGMQRVMARTYLTCAVAECGPEEMCHEPEPWPMDYREESENE